MASAKKKVQQLAREFFKLSVVDGSLAPDRVTGVLAYIEKHRPAHTLAVLRAYRRLIAADIARSQAVVEHAGQLDSAALDRIAAVMTTKYGRRVTSVAQRNDGLLAGIRVRVGDDTYESSIASQLATLAAAV